MDNSGPCCGSLSKVVVVASEEIDPSRPMLLFCEKIELITPFFALWGDR